MDWEGKERNCSQKEEVLSNVCMYEMNNDQNEIRMSLVNNSLINSTI